MTLPFAVVANKESRALKRRLNVAFGVRADGRLGVQGRAGSRGARAPASEHVGSPPEFPPYASRIRISTLAVCLL